MTKIYEDDYLLVVDKPSGIASARLKFDDKESLSTIVFSQYNEIEKVRGKLEWEGGLVHRLDTLTSGLVMFCKTQYAYDFIIKEQLQDRFEKKYRAKISPIEKSDTFINYPYHDVLKTNGTISSLFRSYGSKGSATRPLLVDKYNKTNSRIYYTETQVESPNSVICTLSRGFRHQVRCHLAWSGYAIVGDSLYGSITDGPFGLDAIEISFTHPVTKERMIISKE